MRDSRDNTDRPELADSAQRLVTVVEDCLNRHRDLHNRVLEASEAFFVEHARQAFLATAAQRAVDLYDELLLPVARSTVGSITAAIEAFASASWGLRDLRLAAMEGTFELLLADPRVIEGRCGRDVLTRRFRHRRADGRLRPRILRCGC